MFRRDDPSKKKIEEFSQFVMRGEMSSAEALLINKTINPNTLLNKIRLTESGRQWETVSLIEYAAWAGYISILVMFFRHIPAKDQDIAITQLNDIQERGIEHGKPLAAIKKYVEAYEVYNQSLDSQDFHIPRENDAHTHLRAMKQQLPALWQTHSPRDSVGLAALQAKLNGTISDYKEKVMKKGNHLNSPRHKF